MSDYYKYDFVSPEPIFALVKEELKSYFNTGMVDDILFPVWTDKCLKRLGKGSYDIKQDLVHIDNFKGKLPSDFNSIREAWITSCMDTSFQLPSYTYEN